MPFKSISTQAVSANNVVNPTTLTPPLPTRVNGDLLVAITVCRSITATVATPAGWTIWPGFPKRSTTASGGSVYVFYKEVVGGETAPALVWTGVATGTTGDSSQACVVCLGGVEVVSPSDVTPPAATDASAAHPSIPTLTTATADALVVGVAMKVSDTTQTGTVANGFTERGDFHTTSGTGHALFVATREMTTPGATGASTVTMTNVTAARCLAVSLAVKERVPVTFFGVVARPITFGKAVAGFVPAVPLYQTLVDDFARPDGPVEAGAGAAIWTPAKFDGSGDSFLATIGSWLGTGSPGYQSAYTKTEIDTSGDYDLLIDNRLLPFTTPNEWSMYLLTSPATPFFGGIGVTWAGGTWRLRYYANGALQATLETVPGLLDLGATIWLARRGGVLTVYQRPISGSFAVVLEAGNPWSPPKASVVVELSDTSQRWDDLRGGPIVVSEPQTYYGATALPVAFGAATAGQASTPAVTHYGSVSVAASFGATTAGRRKALGAVAQASTFAAATAAQRRTFGAVARPATFGAATVARRQTFGIVARPSVVGVAVQARRTTFSGTVVPLLFGAATAGVKAAAMKYGAVALPVSFGAATSAQRRTTGAVALPVALGAVTAGRRRTTGAVVLPSTFGAATAGRRRTFSSTVTPVLLSATTAGQRIAAGLYGAATLPISFGATTAARRRTTGAVVLPATFGSTTAGRRRTTGATTLALALGAVVAGRRRTTGAVLLPVAFGATTAGRKIGLTGIVSLPMTLTQVTQGRRRTFGQVALPVTLGEVTAARRRTFGQVARPVTFGEVTAGQRRAFGRVALALALAEVTAGQRRTFGQVALPILLTEVTAARRQALGRVALALVLQPAVTGQRRTFGVVALPLTLDLFSHSRDQGVVLNRADAVYLSGQAADEVSVGAVEVWT